MQPQFATNDINWLNQIGIVRDDHRRIEVLVERIHKQMRGDVHIGPLLFWLFHMSELSPIRQRSNQVRPKPFHEEVAVVHREIGERLHGAE